jgi:hypothetical protein
VIDENHMFISAEEHALSSNLTSTKLTVVISESSYYIKNRQLPIAKLREIIFHNLLFTIVCLEIFRLIILLYKLTILPLLNFTTKHFPETRKIRPTKMENIEPDTTIEDHDIISHITIEDHDIISDIHDITTEDHDIISDIHNITTDNHDTTTKNRGITKDYVIIQVN